MHSALHDIFQVDIPKEPLFSLLGVVHRALKSRDDVYLLQILLAAIKGITINWLKPTVPTLQVWKDIVQELFRMEGITYNLGLQNEKFLKRWYPAFILLY